MTNSPGPTTKSDPAIIDPAAYLAAGSFRKAKLTLDFETASLGNLKTMGAWKYARDPSLRVLCCAYALNSGEPAIWYPGRQPAPDDLLDPIAEGAEIHAWNANFEFAVWSLAGPRIGLPPLPLDRFHCSMARALHWGVPPRLEQAGPALGVKQRKDDEGHALMLRMSRPRAFDDDGKPRWWDLEDPAKLWRLGEYCAQDVRTERAIDDKLPRMPVTERAVWLIDQRMNARGLKVDLEAVDAMQRIVNEELAQIGRALDLMTGGVVTAASQTKRLLGWLQAGGLAIESLDKRVLPAILMGDMTAQQREVLRLYQAGAKTSTAKLKAMRNFLDHDGRVRNILQYGGALRTLRFAGRGVQIQNYPRPWKAKAAAWALSDILAGYDANTIRVCHGDPMEAVSRCLRGAYVAEKGRAFVVVDYSAIEARVVAWLAGQRDILEIFRRHGDVYVHAAHGVGSDNRDLGKVLVLACGYGMGALRFMITAAGYGIVLTFEEAKELVAGWRDMNDRIVAFWYECEDVVRRVIKTGTTNLQWVGDSQKLAFRMANPNGPLAGSMLMQLPSGRCIVYRDIHTEFWDIDEDGEVLTRIAYSGLNLQKQWRTIGTWGGKLVENATQAVARDLLADAMVRLDDAGDLDATIHDELIAEPWLDDAEARLSEIQDVMSNGPAWAAGLPLEAKGAIMTRYGKPD